MNGTAAMVAVGWVSPASREQAGELAARFDLPLAEAGGEALPFQLTLTGERLELRQTGPKAPGPVYVDFAGGATEYRRKHGGGHGQTIARAVGLKGGRRPLVLDATAGLGRDAFVLATLGCRVQLFERSPVVFALLEDGIRRGLTDETIAPIVERLSLMQGDTKDLLARLRDTPPEVVYLDPMYPHRTKSALVKKEMRLLRALVGDDEDAAELLALALQYASDRVVVKRPKTAPPISGPSPSLAVAGKNSRYDIYLTK